MKRKGWVLAGAGVLLVVPVGLVATSGAEPATPAGQAAPANTAPVERGGLSALVSQSGTLTYSARSDGSPYVVINRAGGTYTQLPENGDRVGCGDVLYRVDDEPVLLLCGTVPSYRDLTVGDEGQDVRQLNRNLHQLGRDGDARPDPNDGTFTSRTKAALGTMQRATGSPATGTLALGDAVFLPESMRVAEVRGQTGAAASPGAPVLAATSDRLRVQLNLDPSQQGEVEKGDRASITLPGNIVTTGRVEGFGRVARTPESPDSEPADATIPTYLGLDDPAVARGLDQAPVSVDITTRGVDDALSVPVTALVGRSGGGFAVEVVRPGDRRELVEVQVGLFDSGGGRVQVEGDLRAGDSVVVPSS